MLNQFAVEIPTLPINQCYSLHILYPKGGLGRWGHQGRSLTGGGGPARVPNLRVCKHLFGWGGTRRRGRMN